MIVSYAVAGTWLRALWANLIYHLSSRVEELNWKHVKLYNVILQHAVARQLSVHVTGSTVLRATASLIFRHIRKLSC
jgi:hypothetical protein